jgi:hypothetical protein
VGNTQQREYWTFLWIFFVQTINMAVFVYWFRRLLQRSDDKVVSDTTGVWCATLRQDAAGKNMS